MKTFVDNVSVFAIECCLLSDLGAIFSPSFVLQMDPQLVSEIASEPPSDRLLREQNQKRLFGLQAGLDICRVHVERESSSKEYSSCKNLSAIDIHRGRKFLSKVSHDRPPAPIRPLAADEADYSMEEEVCSLRLYR